MPFDLIATAIRYLMMIVAGHLVTVGYLDASMVEPISGFVIALAAIVWFWLGKWRPGRFRGER